MQNELKNLLRQFAWPEYERGGIVKDQGELRIKARAMLQRLEAEEAFGHISRVNPDDPNTQPEIPSYESIAEMLPGILANASAHCPICGVHGLHKHTPGEIVIYRNGVKYGCSLHGAEEAKTGDAEANTILGLIIADLPTNRDWLDPSTERAARALLKRSTNAPTGMELLMNSDPAIGENYRRVPIEATNVPVGVTDGLEIALNTTHDKCHEAANAFWQYWRENGETHKHGYYESTWGAINAALRLVGVVPHNYGAAPQPPNSDSPSPIK